ncbi:hypothetical protein HYX02_07870 [Candidatus Woesearchaeota archaeon]|nr:hypothetical protein [Candidatus Woesearchaeota archaeon]
MSQTKKEAIAVLIFLLAIVGSLNAFADEVGCCSNPGAGAITCSADLLVPRDKKCCPQPEENFPSYYKSAQNADNPADYNECTTNFFFPNKVCSGIGACALGCCCSELGGSITAGARCKGTGLAFYKGQTNCNQVCPTPQCNDGTDNDNNGCADFEGGDLGCTSPADKSELGGSCTSEGTDCNNPSHIPSLSNLEIKPVKGERKFFLRWKDECSQTSVSYDILRCNGNECTNLELVGTTNTNSFEDSSVDLLFDTAYTYQIKAKYNIQTATPTITKPAELGNLECLGQFSNDYFCIHEPYYNKYREYLTTNFPDDFSKDFASGVRKKFADKPNKAFFCDGFNKLLQEGTSCQSSQVCVVSSNKPSCLNKAGCNYNNANPFGLFYTLEDCETNRYCFYDRSHSTINSCFGCNPSMLCYDYKTESACNRDNCRVGNCKWKNLASQIGIGACISTKEHNCQWCENKGTKALENIKAFNEVFDFCTKEKSDILSDGMFKCYFRNGKAKNCDEMVCRDYDAAQCSDAQITHDENNKIRNPSSDECGIKTCQNINGLCVKNSDGDSKADCTSTECERDYFTPNTTLLPIIRKGVIGSFMVHIYDKTSIKGSAILKTSSDYSTFLCVEPCSSEGHPYSISTSSRTLVVSNLNVFDGTNGNKLLALNEGSSTIRYYSQDTAKNIEEIKKIIVETHSNVDGPKIFSINITGASKVLDKFFTSNQNPIIEIQFFEPAIVTHSRLVNKKTGLVVPLQGNSEPTTKVIFKPTEMLPNGEYTLELNAKNNNNIFMDQPLSQIIVIDNDKPTIDIAPANGTVINSSALPIKLTFNKEVNLDYVKLNFEDITDLFSTTDNKIFTAAMNISDGNKNLEVSARDFAKNQVTGIVSFVVDANPVSINLINPRFGTASKTTFDIFVETDNNAVCRYSLDNNFEFEFMEEFTATGGTLHKIMGFNRIASGDISVHKLNVRCKDDREFSFKSFNINVDITPPKLRSAFAFPNPIIEKPSTTTLTIEADEPVVCRFSTASKEFDGMEGKFEENDNNNFKSINRQQITVENESGYLYYVACKNKAELNSETREITFKVDLTIPISIISHTPEFFNSTNAVLAIETTKKSQCKYSESDSTVESGDIFGAPSYSHTKQLILAPGKHAFYIVCKDQHLQKFSDVAIITFTIDPTPPTILSVDDSSTLENPEFTWSTHSLRVKWHSIDNESKVNRHLYSIVESGTQRIVLDYTQSLLNNEYLISTKPNGISLGLINGNRYFFRVKAQNIVGLLSNTSESDGITVDTSLKPQNCTNKIKDEKESDVDCGSVCDLCELGKKCNINTDCKSNFCNNGLCSAPKCDDNIRNQEESDTDCGGACKKCKNDKGCSSNNDCESNFCNFGFCKPQESCLDNSLSPGESDVDCGGYCPTKCSENRNCNMNEDCGEGLQCILSVCKICEENDKNCNGIPDEQETAAGIKDSDNDGMPDEWEIQNGLNPNDPSDAGLDSDNDGLTNLEEFNVQSTYGQSTNPNKADTDEDGSSDKEEIDKGTNPVDAEDFPKSNLGKTLMFAIGIIVLLAGFGYLGYRAITKRKEEKIGFEMPKQGGIQRAIPQPPPRQAPQKPKEDAEIREIFKRKEELKEKEREKLFETFGKEEKKETKEAEDKPQGKKEEKIPKVAKKEQTKKPKEDVFVKLKEIAKKKPRQARYKAQDKLSKLYRLTKSKKKKK